jgi:tetratricopeptide (TPR) repeat protein
MELTNSLETGSIKDIKGRLVLWARRSPKGLARVEFASEFSRQRVVQQVRSALTEQKIPFHEINLPSQQDPEILVAALLQELAQVKQGVVSITGFATAFTNKVPLEEAMRILNFNRERLVAHAFNQIWWMTPSFMQTSIHAMLDINSWFSLRLQLTEMVLMEPMLVEQSPVSSHGVYANIDDTRRRVHNLLQRFQQAQSAGTPDLELIQTYLLPALEALADVGAQKDLRDLTLQFEGLLGQLKLTDSPELADSLNRLAKLYYEQGRYSEAEPLLLRSLAIRESNLGADHPSVAIGLNNLAELYRTQGRYNEAEPLYLRSQDIWERILGDDHLSGAPSLNNLAALYKSQGRYKEAEPLYLRSKDIFERELGADHASTATTLNNLAALYKSQGRYNEAEPLYRRSLVISEHQLGADHPDVANSLNNLAALYRKQGRYSETEPLFLRSLAIYEHQLGADHPSVAISLNNLAVLYSTQGRYNEAEPLYRRSIAIYEHQLGADHPSVATGLNNLAFLYISTERFTEAEPLLVRALASRQQLLGDKHPDTLDTLQSLNNVRQILKSQKRTSGKRSRQSKASKGFG